MARVAILDAGSQFGKLIDRKIRELSVESEILPFSTSASKLLEDKYNAIIISGSPDSASKLSDCGFHSELFSCGLPVLGICYGMQLLNKTFGGRVEVSESREDGVFEIEIDTTVTLFSGLNKKEKVLLTHQDNCYEPAKGFKVIAKSGKILSGICDESRKLYGVQFHPEVDLTVSGKRIFENFLFKICQLTPSFTLPDRIESCKKHIREVVGGKVVFVLLSGGVDSTVCAVLLSKCISPSQIVAVHIDNGFMRKGESALVMDTLSSLGISVRFLKADYEFRTGMTTFPVKVRTEQLSPTTVVPQRDSPSDAPAASSEPLSEVNMDVTAQEDSSTKIDDAKPVSQVSHEIKPSGSVASHVESRNILIGPLGTAVTNPEEKRRIIGDVFIRVSENTWKEFRLDTAEILLCQGTLRPDLIESASHLVSGRADVIKTHHNTTPMVQRLQKQGRVLEPLANFHKDEVREIGRKLGLPDAVVQRHPFPGPGLAIRILCAVEPWIDRNFTETTSLIKMIVGYHSMSQHPHALLSRINNTIQQSEQTQLAKITSTRSLAAHLLPIRSVGVQGDCRTYNYACALSSSSENPNWDDLAFIAHVIPRVCSNINRVVFVFGPRVAYPVNDITITRLSVPVIETAREADARAMELLFKSKVYDKISQMPVVLIPIHFDRDPLQVVPVPSVQRSVVLRPVVTTDFMTGIAAIPGVHLPVDVVNEMYQAVASVPGISRVLYDLTSKPPGTIEWE